MNPSDMDLRSQPARTAQLVSDQIEKPPLDKRSYRLVRLANHLEVLLAHDPEADIASAALDVGVGNLSDDRDMQGMAHAVEHLLFLGTKTFPEENDYSHYLSTYSGYSNAYTASTSTNYYFELCAKPANDNDEPVSASNPSPLHGALDRFSKFFIEPLFLASVLDRELRAVDSEHKKNLQDDLWRKHRLEKSLVNPEHPFSNFSTGNYEILKSLPEAQGINVRDKFIEFYDKHYSANRMKLCILGREPLDLLESWAVGFFSHVPNKNLKPNRWDNVPLYTDNELACMTYVKPVMDKQSLSFRFPIPEERELYESKPSYHLAHLVGHEGPGSFMAHTKSRGWVHSVDGGAFDVCPGTDSVFQCTVNLTKDGLKHWQDIAEIFFHYIAMLRENVPQEWIFREIKTMSDVSNRFKETVHGSSFTRITSSVMQNPLPREWLLSSSVLRKYEPELILRVLSGLSPDKCRLTLTSQKVPGDWNRKEKYYGTEYRTEKIPAEFLQRLRQAAGASSGERSPELRLPNRNSFIPTKLEVDKKAVEAPATAPRLIRNDCRAQTWWKKDDQFWVPRANVLVSFESPLIGSSAEERAKTDLYSALVMDALKEYAYDASLAGLEYSCSSGAHGLELELSGYNDKLPVLLEKILVTMRDLEIKQGRFEILKEDLKRNVRNRKFRPPYMQIRGCTDWIVETAAIHANELLAEIPGTTLEDVRQFPRRFLTKFFFRVYVNGNMCKDDALTLTELVETTIRPRVLPRSEVIPHRTLVIPPGSNFVFEQALEDPGNVNHAIGYILFTGPRNDRSIRAKSLMLEQILKEPAFDQLRTKESLGYAIFTQFFNFTAMQGIGFMLQSDKPPRFLESRIEAFLESFTKTLEDMPGSTLEDHKRSLVSWRLQKLKSLRQEATLHQFHIMSDYYEFDSALHDAENVKSITKADLLDIWHRAINPLSEQRAKLSTHLFALGALPPDEQIEELAQALELSETDGLLLKHVLLQSEKRHSPSHLKEYLLHEMRLSTEKADKILKLASESQKTPVPVDDAKKRAAETEVIPPPSGPKPVIITDLFMFRSGLKASKAPTPANDLSVYEDIGAKL